MNHREQLIAAFSQSGHIGGGVHSGHEIAYLLAKPYNAAFKKYLTDCVHAQILRRVAQGIYECTLTPPDSHTALYQIIKKMRPGFLTYISLESQLSYSGDISQVVFDRVTLMTKGRAGTFNTPYGVIEMTHTKKPIRVLMPNLYFDADIKMYRATTQQAIADLKACKRNLHLLENLNA